MNKITTNTDISDFSDVIMELRHKFNAATLEDDITHLTPQVSPSTRFLIKMEIMNLSRKVSHVIDLRNLFQKNCKEFTFQGVLHYLDDVSKKEFINEVNNYSGTYTLGVYKQISKKAKQRYRANPNEGKFPKTNAIHLTGFYQRREERLYFIRKISLFFNSPEKMSKTAFEHFAIEGITTDISSSGLAIKVLTQKVIRKNGLVHVWIHGIENEYTFRGRVIVTYEIKNSYKKNEYTYLNLNYHNEQFCNTAEQFFSYANNYLQTQKKRNNISVENTINAIAIKASEQFVISRLNSLAVFLIHKNGTWLPYAQFKTLGNQDIGRFGKNRNNKDFLHSCCALPYIQAELITGKRFSYYIVVIPISDNQSKTRYIALPHNLLLANSALKERAQLALQNNQLLCYRIDGNTVEPDSQCYVPSSLPSTAGDAFTVNNEDTLERAKALAKGLTRMVTITDLTDSIRFLHLFDDDTDTDVNKQAINFSSFVLKKPTLHQEILSIYAETNDLRKEDRFITELCFHLQMRSFQQNQFVSGSTVNISCCGLKIQLSPNFSLNSGDRVHLHFPDLQKNEKGNKKFHPYYVVGKESNHQYRLSLDGKVDAHTGRKLLNTYINSHREDLPVLGYGEDIAGLSRVLRNIFSNNLHLPHGITAKHTSGSYIKEMALSANSSLPTFAEEPQVELLNLMNNNAFRQAIVQQIELTPQHSPYHNLYFVVMPRTRTNGDKYFFVKQIEEDEKHDELRKLLSVLGCIGNPRIVRINGTAKGHVFDKYFIDEKNYMECYAAIKLKPVIDQLQDTLAIFNIMDITDMITHQTYAPHNIVVANADC
ncbi:hypothetical protein [Psychromonas sp. MME2]|uniref:hypothetical protein n=1 Tax=unclassified Psychromonas TaxID=2614957 RepID=UPI00339CFEE9